MKKAAPSKFLRSLKRCPVPRGSVAVAGLGQSGFVLKSPKGTLVALDPYLSDSCAGPAKASGMNMARLFPSPLSPTDLLHFDAIILTHSHQDHLDPRTISPYLEAGGQGPFVAPHETAERLQALGVRSEQILVTWPNYVQRIADFTLKAMLAIPGGPDDLNHLGYLLEAEGTPRIYFTGDTDYNEILSLQVAPFSPDILVTVINGAFRNLSPAQAATLAKAVQPRWVVPCHHDLFPDNSLPDRLLRTNLSLAGMERTFCPLEHGKIKLFREKKKRKPLA